MNKPLDMALAVEYLMGLEKILNKYWALVGPNEHYVAAKNALYALAEMIGDAPQPAQPPSTSELYQRRSELVDTKYMCGLNEAERVELEEIDGQLNAVEKPYYDAMRERIRGLLEQPSTPQPAQPPANALEQYLAGNPTITATRDEWNERYVEGWKDGRDDALGVGPRPYPPVVEDEQPAAGVPLPSEVTHWIDVVTSAILATQDYHRPTVGIAASALVGWLVTQRQREAGDRQPPNAAILDAMDRLLNRLMSVFDDDIANMPDPVADDYLAVHDWIEKQPAASVPLPDDVCKAIEIAVRVSLYASDGLVCVEYDKRDMGKAAYTIHSWLQRQREAGE